MTIVRFPQKPAPASHWGSDEFNQIMQACSRAVSTGDAGHWEVGATERGDPQVYLLGPPPDHDCILCISRIGQLYIIEDGHGRVLVEHDSPVQLAEQAVAALRRRKAAIVAHIAVAWSALREFFEEKTEAVAAEPVELLVHIAPQLAVIA